MSIRYDRIVDGVWQYPVMRGYRLACCECSAVHDLDFRIIAKGKRLILSFKATRNKRATAAARKGKLASEYEKALLDTADKQVKQIAKAASHFKDLPLAKKPALAQAGRKRLR